MTRVPIARKSLFSERPRAALGLGGVILALLIVLALDGIFAGTMLQVTRYIDTAEADVFVSQAGVRNMHMSSSSIPATSVEEVASIEGVTSVAPILYESSALRLGPDRQLSYFIGFETGFPGGPVSLESGELPDRGEIVLDRRAASGLGAGLGDRVLALGRDWRVSGLTSDMTNITNTVSYVGFSDFAEARTLQRTASFLLVTTESPTATARRIERATGLPALTKEEFSAEERRIVQDMAADLMRIMTIAAFLIGLAVVALVLYSATLSRLREVGVMKALGATNRATAGVVLSQAAWTVLPAVAIAAGVTMLLGLALKAAGSDTAIAVTVPSVLRAGLGAVLLGAVGAVAPLVKVMRVDPITVFRR
jgi:putative ABC transport system permease protein